MESSIAQVESSEIYYWYHNMSTFSEGFVEFQDQFPHLVPENYFYYVSPYDFEAIQG